MPASRTPPPKGSFQFVLRKERRCLHDPSIENRIAGYDESAITRDITHRDGLRAQTVFVQGKAFAQRLRCLGWEDVTEMWDEGTHPTGAAGQTDALTLARQAAELAEDSGGVEAIDG